MLKITKFQLFCLLALLLGPIAYIELPHRLVHILSNNAWLAIPPGIIPGLLLIMMYCSIIRKSTKPFPLLLDEHLGKYAGRVLGFIYFFIFLLICGFTLRLFIEFFKMNILPATPISIFIAVLLLIGFAAIKSGFDNFVRVCELIVLIGGPLSIIIVLIAVLNNFHLDRLRPIAYMDYKSFGMGVLQVSSVLGRMMLVLSLAFFLDKNDQSSLKSTMNRSLWLYIPYMAFVTLGVIITLGAIPAGYMTFPTFNMIRLARVGAFIQNIDIIFIGFWILGIFGAITIFWFMACFTAQQIFNLRDYRFLAAPSSLIIGISAILMGRNNLEVVVWSTKFIPIVYILFLIIIPLIIFIITLFKPLPENASQNTSIE